MKKLFTLIALLTMFMSANAKLVIDAEVNFADYPDGPSTLSAWGGGDKLSFLNGCLHFSQDEKTANPWDVQFFPINSASLEADVTYTIEFKIKGTGGPIFNMAFGGVDKYGVYTVPASDEWQVVQVEYVVTDPTKNSGGVLFQCGEYVGSWDMEYMKISHEEEESSTPEVWVNSIVNGDAEGEFGDIACLQSKTFVKGDSEASAKISPAEIMEEADGNHCFVVHSKAVDPTLKFDVETELWGTTYPAGADKPDNAWQNQAWLTFTRPLKDGEQYKISFRYKADRAINADTQNHRLPGDYLGNSSIDSPIKFTTEWQTYEKKISAVGDMQSIAFNLGSQIYTEDVDFFFDDIQLCELELEKGFFIAGIDNTNDDAKYDYDHAIKFEQDPADETFYSCQIGTVGDEESWVNEVMISTVRGNSKAYQAATLKATIKSTNGDFVDLSETSKAKIKLPARGVYTVEIYNDELLEVRQVAFTKLDGEADKEPIVIVANPAEITVNGVEREYKSAEEAPEGYEFQLNDNLEEIVGYDWDNQLVIMGNRALESGEETIIEFDFVATTDATVGTQCGGGEYAGQYIHWAALDNLPFTTEEQHFYKEFKVPTEANGMQAFNFNMAVIKEACSYTIKNVIWKLADDTETLIDMEGTANFYVKEGAGTTPRLFGTDPEIPDAIKSVVTNAPATVTYNLAGQAVSKDFKGIVVKNGNKYVVK